jgi:hypothetical protein
VSASAQRKVDEFNRFVPVGTTVDVYRDSGEVKRTKTRSEAWVLGTQGVVQVEGIAGCYLLDRVKVVAPEAV